MNIMSKFNLPTYLKGKSFSEASAMIAKRFEGRNSPEDVETLNELQGRLQQAQEFVKSEQESKSEPQHQMPDGSMMDGAAHGQEGAADEAQAPAGLNEGAVPSGAKQLANEYYDGGRPEVQGLAGGLTPVGVQNVAAPMAGDLAPKHSDAVLSPASGGAKGSGMPGAGAVVGAASALMDMGSSAFGPTGIDTSGRSAPPDVPSQGSSAASGALKGASAGAAFGPWGAAIGGVLGGAAGLIGGGKAKRDAQEAAMNNDMKLHNDATNDYKSGGSLVANMYEHGGEHDFMSENDKYMAESRVGQPLAGSTLVANNSIDFMAENDKFMNESRIGQPLASIQPRARVTSLFDDGELDRMTTGVQDVSSMTTELQKRRDPNHDKSPWDENSGSKFNAAEALRYAPSLSNAMQLSNLKKPEQQGMDRLGNKYNEQLVDERGLQNTVQENVLNNRNALLSSSGGSGSSARANLLASQLQGGKVQSQAYQQAGEANRKENRAGQAFNKDTDKTNLIQSNLENRTNLELQAGYDSNKSKLIAQLGQDLGGIGKEEMFKKFPELMGLSYGAQGEHFRTLKAAQDKKKAERMLKKSKKK